MAVPGETAGQLSLERLKALTDGVVAIVITILVLDLDVPEGHDFSQSGLIAFFGRIEHQLLPYIASFCSVAGFWIVHNAMINFVGRTDRAFLWLNVAFMLPLTLVPYVTQLRVAYRGTLQIAIIFGAVQILSSLLLIAIWRYEMRHLRRAPILPAVIRSMHIRMTLLIILNLIGVSMVPVSEYVSSLFFAFAPFLFLKHRLVDAHCREG